MVVKLGKYRFEKGNLQRELCPYCLEEVKKSSHSNCFPKGTIALKKDNYVLIRVSHEEPIVKRMLSLLKIKEENGKEDDNKEFILLYVDKTFVGFKGESGAHFIPNFQKKEYEDILLSYIPRSERKKKAFAKTWKFAKEPIQGYGQRTSMRF